MKWSLAELRRRPRRRWPRLLALACVALAGAVVLFGFFGLPGILRPRAAEELSRLLARSVTIEAARVNPFRLSAALEGVAVKETNGSPLLSIREVSANLGFWATLLGKPHLQDVSLDGISLYVVRNDDGTLNLAQLGPAQESAPAPTEAAPVLPHLRLDRATLRDTTVHVRSEHDAETLVLRFSELAAELHGLDTTHTDANALFQLSATVESGGRIDLRAALSPTLAQLSGTLTVSDANLAVLSPVVSSALPLTLRSGSATLETDFRITRVNTQTRTVLENASLRLKDLQLVAKGDAEPFLTLTAFSSTGGTVDSDTREVQAGKLAIEGIKLDLQRDASGLQPLARLQSALAVPAAPGSAAPTTPATSRDSALKIAFTALEIDGPGVRFRDGTGARHVDVSTESLRVKAGALNLSAADQAWPIEGEVALRGGGVIRMAGELTPATQHAAVSVELVDLPLAPWGPYLEQFADVWLATGRTGGSLRLTWKNGQGAITGKTSVSDVSLVDNQANAPLITWKQLELEDLALDVPSFRSRVGEIRWVEPRINAAVSREGRLNFAALLKPAAASAVPIAKPVAAPGAPNLAPATASPGTPRAATSPLPFAIGRLHVEGARLSFSDGMMQPVVTVALSDLSGTIERIDSTSTTSATVQLEGRLGTDAPLRIRGDVQALGAAPSADLRLDLTRLDLVPLTPYSVRYTGYGVERGHLSIESRVRLARNALDTANRITVERLTLGERQPSPQATNLPVPLALALLTDSRGRLTLDLPVAGRVDDPAFHIGPTVARTLVGLLTKVATSPFALLGAAFGGGGEELAVQLFDAGAPQPRENEVKKLATLHRALADRPGLRVELTGQFDPAVDRAPLRERELARRIDAVARRLQQAAGLPEDAPLAPTTEVAALAALFAENFPEVVAAQAAAAAARAIPSPTPVPEVSVSAPAPDANRDGLLARLLRLLAERLRRPAGPATSQAATPAPAPAVTPSPVPATESVADAPQVAPITPEQMAAQLLATVEIDDAALQELARARANAVRERLLQGTGLSPERVSVGSIRAGSARVELSLK